MLYTKHSKPCKKTKNIMQPNSEYRNMASDSLTGKWGGAAVIMIIYFLIYAAASALLGTSEGSFAWQMLAYFLLFPMSWGVSVAFLKVARGSDIDYGSLFVGYNDFLRIALTGLLRYVYIVLWSLLLVVPGIIKAYSYSMTPYILNDDADMKYDKAIEKSMAMMDGHKLELFVLDLSFIGWGILCLFTFGIGFLFLIPYMEAAHAHFYEDLKHEADEAGYTFV